MKHFFRNQWYTTKQLSEMSGIAGPTIRDRLRRGYSLEEALRETPIKDSVKEFNEASHWEDWIGMSINELHKIYWNWCVSSGYTPESIQCFSRHIMSMYPTLKIIPMQNEDKCYRYIRLRG